MFLVSEQVFAVNMATARITKSQLQLLNLLTKSYKKRQKFGDCYSMRTSEWSVWLTRLICARCFCTGGKKLKHDAISDLFGTTEEIITSLTRLPSTTSSSLPSSLLSFKLRKPPLPVLFFLLGEIILSLFLAQPQNLHLRKHSKLNSDSRKMLINLITLSQNVT